MSTADDDVPLIWVCRDIAGYHVGGPACFCCPTVIRADEPEDQAWATIEAANRVN